MFKGTEIQDMTTFHMILKILSRPLFHPNQSEINHFTAYLVSVLSLLGDTEGICIRLVY